MKAISTRTKTRDRVFATPIQLMAKPPKSAPKTVAVFQVLVLHVAALGYVFLGTIRPISEKIRGQKTTVKIRQKTPEHR